MCVHLCLNSFWLLSLDIIDTNFKLSFVKFDERLRRFIPALFFEVLDYFEKRTSSDIFDSPLHFTSFGNTSIISYSII